ncbi:hypothetical protein WA588_000497, partial [Blastocystis sp. NMH]
MDTETHIENSTPCPTELEDRLSYLRTQEQQLRKDYDKCIAWRVRYFTAFTLLSVPISIWTKRYSPLFAAAIIGSGADVWEAKVKCGKIADQLDDIIVEKEQKEKTLSELT